MDIIYDKIAKTPLNGTCPVPKDLRERPQWVCYRLKPWPDGKTDKIPVDPESGQDVAAQTPDNWMSFDRAVAWSHERDHVDGVGFVLTARDGFACVDIDGCVTDGEPDEWAAQIIRELDSYAELSPSGKGVHVWVYGDVPDVKGATRPIVDGHRIEVYTSGRFMTVTGDHLRGCPSDVGSAYRVMAAWYADAPHISPAKTRTDHNHAPMPADGFAVDDVIARLDSERDPEKFRKLFYDGDYSLYDGNASSADGALIQKVVFYTGGDVDLAENVMRRSALVRDKWDEPRPSLMGGRTTWLRRDIQNAIAEKGPDDFLFSSGGYYPPLNDERQTEANVSFSSLGEPPGNHDEKEKTLRFMTLGELIDEAGEDVDFIAPPYFARGGLTDLSGPAKLSGKTTFTLELVSSLLDGGEFLSRPTQQARVLYLTEQGANFVQSAEKAGLDPEHPGLRILPYHLTSGFKWPEIVNAVAGEAEAFGADLIVVDTLNRFAGLVGEQENQAGHVAAIMNPLLHLAQSKKKAVLTIRHANKEGKGRGSTQFDHDVDQLLILRSPQHGNYGANVRELESYGRYDNTTRKIELTDDGYRDLGEEGAAKKWQAVNLIRDALIPHKRNNPMRGGDLKAALQGEVSDATIDRGLDWMFKAAIIDKTRLNSRGKPWAYYWGPLVGIDIEGFEDWRNEAYDKVMNLTA